MLIPKILSDEGVVICAQKTATRATVAKRKTQAEFVRRGMAAIDATNRSGSGIPADVVLAKLEAKLAAAIRHKREDDDQ